jgi:hypothetical protein
MGPGIDWVIIGGESGPGARPCDISQIGEIVALCARARVPAFVKQVGDNPICSPGPITWPVTVPGGSDPAEWPDDIRTRQPLPWPDGC